MNIPNRLTVLRLIMVPVFFISFCLPEWFGEGARMISVVLMLICYVTAELSDLLDGKIARKYHLVTDLGKVMDPFADTLSHLTFFVCFYGMGLMPAIAFIIIMWREFSILFLRRLMMGKGKAVAAPQISGERARQCSMQSSLFSQSPISLPLILFRAAGRISTGLSLPCSSILPPSQAS